MGSRWRAAQLRAPRKIIGVRLIACSCCTCNQLTWLAYQLSLSCLMKWTQTWLGPHIRVNPLGFRASCLCTIIQCLLLSVVGASARLLGSSYSDFCVLWCTFPTHHQTARTQRVVDSVIHLFHSVMYACIHSGGCDLCSDGGIVVLLYVQYNTTSSKVYQSVRVESKYLAP